MKLGFMQGRLVNSEKKNFIQYFPDKNWPKEMRIANKIGFKIIEWTIDSDNIEKNPIFNGDLKNVKKFIKKYKIKIPSITLDYFMQKPFFKKKNINNKDEIKFVLSSREDYEWAKTFIKEENLIDKAPIIFSPVYENLSYENLSEWILEDNLTVRFQVQLHKIIWGEKKGV